VSIYPSRVAFSADHLYSQESRSQIKFLPIMSLRDRVVVAPNSKFKTQMRIHRKPDAPTIYSSIALNSPQPYGATLLHIHPAPS
jgi:hypothetical protein